MIVSGARVVTPGRDLGVADVRIENGVITEVGEKVSLTNRSRQTVGETPVAAAKARERYSRVEKPESAAISFIASEEVSRRRFASEIRVSAICFCTDDDRHSLNARSTSVREKPTWRNTSDAAPSFCLVVVGAWLRNSC